MHILKLNAYPGRIIPNVLQEINLGNFGLKSFITQYAIAIRLLLIYIAYEVNSKYSLISTQMEYL